ncbi:MAG TPA: hypothetical protein PL041_11880 [Melioribacteraceae bacterium]|nr:hypothetical protein [Melioribacteraceae bacterium]
MLLNRLSILLFIIISFYFFGCNNDIETEKIEINGYDKINWAMNIDEIKLLLNKNYKANLYEFFSLENDTSFYNFNSGKFKEIDVYKWEMKYYKNDLVSVKLYFNQMLNMDEIFKKLFNKDFDKKKTKVPFIQIISSSKTDKNITKLILNSEKNFTTLLIQKVD